MLRDAGASTGIISKALQKQSSVGHFGGCQSESKRLLEYSLTKLPVRHHAIFEGRMTFLSFLNNRFALDMGLVSNCGRESTFTKFHYRLRHIAMSQETAKLLSTWACPWTQCLKFGRGSDLQHRQMQRLEIQSNDSFKFYQCRSY